jgi:transcription elongation factor Elf1
MITKHKYIRSKKLLKLVSELDCQRCGSGQYVQAAHTNWGGGKGRGIKADDNLIAALCQECHFMIDQGSKWSKEQRKEAWTLAHVKTVKELTTSGKWLIDIPVPDIG